MDTRSKSNVEFRNEVSEILAQHESKFDHINSTLQTLLTELQALRVSHCTGKPSKTLVSNNTLARTTTSGFNFPMSFNTSSSSSSSSTSMFSPFSSSSASSSTPFSAISSSSSSPIFSSFSNPPPSSSSFSLGSVPSASSSLFPSISPTTGFSFGYSTFQSSFASSNPSSAPSPLTTQTSLFGSSPSFGAFGSSASSAQRTLGFGSASVTSLAPSSRSTISSSGSSLFRVASVSSIDSTLFRAPVVSSSPSPAFSTSMLFRSSTSSSNVISFAAAPGGILFGVSSSATLFGSSTLSSTSSALTFSFPKGTTSSTTTSASSLPYSTPTFGILGSPPNQRGKPDMRTPITFQHITNQEAKEDREKRLCYYCDEKFIPGHWCERLQLFMIEDSPSPDYISDDIMEQQTVQEFSFHSTSANHPT